MSISSSRREPTAWLVTMVKVVATIAVLFGGLTGLLLILGNILAEPKPPKAPLIENPIPIGAGALIAVFAAAGLIWAYGKGQRSRPIRLCGLIAVDMIYVIGVVLFRVFAA